MKNLKLTLVLLLTATCLYGQDKVLVQLQSDRVCINRDTCFAINANIVLTKKHFYVTDYIAGDKLDADVRLYEKNGNGYFAYATTENLSAYILMDGEKVEVDYSFEDKRFLLVYRVRVRKGISLIKYN